jgi:hypothetical protein
VATSLQYPGRAKIQIADVLLKDIARRIQLSPTDYRTAVGHYEAVDKFLNKEGNPLAPYMVRMYAQGSMAIGATISSKLNNDEFDVDAVAELNLPASAPPGEVLDLLFNAVNGEKGSIYHGKVKRRTRCVTLEYDRMHLDVTPAVLLPQYAARTSVIFHANEEEDAIHHRHIKANPWGFADWFEQSTPAVHEIVEAVLRKTAEPVPDQDEVIEKSHPLVALQLLKRWRNKRYDNRQGRCPPSVVLAYYVGSNPTGAADLYGEFRAQAEGIHAVFAAADQQDKLISVVNPACNTDVLSDRWPGDLETQRVFLSDLRDLLAKLDKLEADPSVEKCAEIMSDLFGENPTRLVVEDFQKRFAAKANSGSLFALGGGAGGLALGSSGLAAKPLTETAYPIRPHTDFGSDG